MGGSPRLTCPWSTVWGRHVVGIWGFSHMVIEVLLPQPLQTTKIQKPEEAMTDVKTHKHAGEHIDSAQQQMLRAFVDLWCLVCLIWFLDAVVHASVSWWTTGFGDFGSSITAVCTETDCVLHPSVQDFGNQGGAYASALVCHCMCEFVTYCRARCYPQPHAPEPKEDPKLQINVD